LSIKFDHFLLYKKTEAYKFFGFLHFIFLFNSI